MKEKKEAIELCLKENEFFCPEVLDLFYLFTHMANDYLNSMVNFLYDEVEFEYDKMDIRESIDLVREFLGNIDKKYLEIFEQSLNDGTFDLFLPEDDLVERPENPITTPKPQANINIPVKYTVEDGAIIIHEFFHFLNDTDDLVGVREIFTEMISIYYEIRYYQFIVKKGYDDKNYYKEVYSRMDSTFDSADNLCFTSSALDIYYNTGDITEENIEFIDINRNLYKDNIDTIMDFYNEETFEDNINEFRIDVSYVIGTLLAFFALKEPKVYDIKMKYINQNVNDLSIQTILNILDVKLGEYPIWIEECVENLKKALGEIYGEDYSNSRSYWSR